VCVFAVVQQIKEKGDLLGNITARAWLSKVGSSLFMLFSCIHIYIYICPGVHGGGTVNFFVFVKF